MQLTTTYSVNDTVYIVVGSDEKAVVIESSISSIEIIANSNSIETTYNCIVDRQLTNTMVNGIPRYYTVKRKDIHIFSSAVECCADMIKRKEQQEKWKQKS